MFDVDKIPALNDFTIEQLEHHKANGGFCREINSAGKPVSAYYPQDAEEWVVTLKAKKQAEQQLLRDQSPHFVETSFQENKGIVNWIKGLLPKIPSVKPPVSTAQPERLRIR